MSAVAHVITFRSSKFDVTKERPNPINPIAGESVLAWLREQLKSSSYEVTTPDTEDWGWYVYVKAAEATYLVGASADATEYTDSDIDWTIQIHRERSLKDRITGANKLTADDRLSRLTENIIRAEPGIQGVEVDRDA
jgi:hypothetical protein